MSSLLSITDANDCTISTLAFDLYVASWRKISFMGYFIRKFDARQVLRTPETVHSQGETFTVAQRSQSYKEPILGLMHLRLQFYDRLGDRRLLAKIERHLGHCRSSSTCVSDKDATRDERR